MLLALGWPQGAPPSVSALISHVLDRLRVRRCGARHRVRGGRGGRAAAGRRGRGRLGERERGRERGRERRGGDRLRGCGGVARRTAFRPPLFFAHISVSLHGKSYPSPTGFHTFYVVHILITHAGSPVHALKSVRPRSIPRGPSHATNGRPERTSELARSCCSRQFWQACRIRRARPGRRTSCRLAPMRLVRRGGHHRDDLRPNEPVQHARGTQRGWVRLG